MFFAFVRMNNLEFVSLMYVVKIKFVLVLFANMSYPMNSLPVTLYVCGIAYMDRTSVWWRLEISSLFLLVFFSLYLSPSCLPYPFGHCKLVAVIALFVWKINVVKTVASSSQNDELVPCKLHNNIVWWFCILTSLQLQAHVFCYQLAWCEDCGYDCRRCLQACAPSN